MSALPPKADIAEHNWDVRFVPTTDIERPGLLCITAPVAAAVACAMITASAASASSAAAPANAIINVVRQPS
jgi:hypothetical protein